MESVNGSFNGKDLFREKLQTILNDYKITLKTLSKVTQIDYLWLTDYVNGKKNRNDLSMMDMLSLSRLIIMLSDGMELVDEDERISGVIDVLSGEFEIKIETLAIYAGLEIEDLKSFMKDTNSISYQKRYKLATTTLFLHYLFKKPSGVKEEND